MRQTLQILGVLCLACIAPAAFAQNAGADQQDNPNLAFEAIVEASSEYGIGYEAMGAIDGRVAAALSHSDTGVAWAKRGDACQGAADFWLEWDEPKVVSTVVYYGRTGSAMIEECFGDYEVYLDSDDNPVAKGSFEAKHGPQWVEFSPRAVSTIRIRFLSGHDGGLNWGASEIAVFEKRPTLEELEARVSPEVAEAADGLTIESFQEAGMPEEILFCTRKPGTDEHWYANFGYYADNVYRRPFPLGSGGGLYALNVNTGAVRTIFEDPEGNIRDPQVHYDGETILFSYIPKGKFHYSLYTIKSDGTELTRLTGEGEDDELELPPGVTPLESSESRTSVKPLGNERDFAPPGWDDYEPMATRRLHCLLLNKIQLYVGCLFDSGRHALQAFSGRNVARAVLQRWQDNTPASRERQIIYMLGIRRPLAGHSSSLDDGSGRHESDGLLWQSDSWNVHARAETDPRR